MTALTPSNKDNVHAFIALQKAQEYPNHGIDNNLTYYKEHWHKAIANYRMAQVAFEVDNDEQITVCFNSLENAMRDKSHLYEVRAINCVLANDFISGSNIRYKEFGSGKPFYQTYAKNRWDKDNVASFSKVTFDLMDEGYQPILDSSTTLYYSKSSCVCLTAALAKTAFNAFCQNSSKDHSEYSANLENFHSLSMGMVSALTWDSKTAQEFQDEILIMTETAAKACIKMGCQTNASLHGNIPKLFAK